MKFGESKILREQNDERAKVIPSLYPQEWLVGSVQLDQSNVNATGGRSASKRPRQSQCGPNLFRRRFYLFHDNDKISRLITHMFQGTEGHCIEKCYTLNLGLMNRNYPIVNHGVDILNIKN